MLVMVVDEEQIRSMPVINSSNIKVKLTSKEKFYANKERLKQNEINKQQCENQ